MSINLYTCNQFFSESVLCFLTKIFHSNGNLETEVVTEVYYQEKFVKIGKMGTKGSKMEFS